jgi:hypothetical protein
MLTGLFYSMAIPARVKSGYFEAFKFQAMIHLTRCLAFAILLQIPLTTFTQTTGLKGTVTTSFDGKVEELIGASIRITQRGKFVAGTVTDVTGNYKVKLDPGIYDLEATYTGVERRQIFRINVKEGESGKLDLYMESGIMLQEVVIHGYGLETLKENMCNCIRVTEPVSDSIPALKLNLEVALFPNPASDRATIEMSFDADVIQVFDVAGKLVRSLEKPGSGKNTLFVGDLSYGMYLVKIVAGKQDQTKKLMVIR